MKNIVLIIVLSATFCFCADSKAKDCVKSYQYGQDASSCFDKKREILKQSGKEQLKNKGYVVITK